MSGPVEETLSPLQSTDMGFVLIKMLLAMTSIVIFLFIAYWVLRRLIQNRFQKGNSKQTIVVLEKKMVSQKTVLYLIEVEGKKILFAESHLEIRTLDNHLRDETTPA